MWTPPEFEMEDYYGIQSTADVRSAGTTSYVMCAPGVAFALGTPRDNGGLEAKSVIIGQVAADNTNDPYYIFQLDSNRVAQAMMNAELDQSSSEAVVRVLGNQSLMIPKGTTVQRPNALSPTAAIRLNTDVFSGADTLETYDSQTGKWKQYIADAGGAGAIDVVFTETTLFSYDHDMGEKPSVAVTDSNSFELEVCVRHQSENTVVIYFNGTITNGHLLLNV